MTNETKKRKITGVCLEHPKLRILPGSAFFNSLFSLSVSHAACFVASREGTYTDNLWTALKFLFRKHVNKIFVAYTIAENENINTVYV